jgi:hypothetical protein
MEYIARKLKEEYEKWGLAINLEKNQMCMCGRRNRNFKIWRRGRNNTMYRMCLLRYVQKYTSRAIIKHRISQTRKAINN